jgi:putative DNA primase/helicase
MTFIDFCRAHGVLIDALPPVGVWRRLKTEDKGSKRNGAVKFMGDHGFVQNWATMTEPAAWRADKPASVGVQQQVQKASQDAAQAQAKAADKATWIVGQCKTAEHAYLAAKGFPAEVGNVWQAGDAPLLVIPMRVAGSLVGCQLIGEGGTKKFLTGQRTGHAEFVFANGGHHILCEGYATALSARHALKNLKRRYTLHVCFSAGNMLKVAAGLPGGFVLADNDASGTGEKAAREIGWPFWMSDRVGEDANDFHLRMGLFALAQELGGLIRSG